MSQVRIEGKHLRWIVTGALREYYKRINFEPTEEQFQHYVSDTCNRMHMYLTTGGAQGADGSASDLQCTLLLEVYGMFGYPKCGEVTIFW